MGEVTAFGLDALGVESAERCAAWVDVPHKVKGTIEAGPRVSRRWR